MNDGFNKFTERARGALNQAQQAAQRLDNNYIGPEHLLLGLMGVRDGMAAQVLTSLGINLEETCGTVEGHIARGAREGAGEMGLTPRAKRVIELAVKEAFQMRHHYIGTEHLLLGLAREGEASGESVLASLGAGGLTLERLRAGTREILATYHPGDAPLEATTAERRAWRRARRGWRWLPWRRGS